MLFIRLCTLALITSASLAACNSYEQTSIDNKTNVVQASETIVGEVTEVMMQDREQQKITLVAKDGRTYTAFISQSNFGQAIFDKVFQHYAKDYNEKNIDQRYHGCLTECIIPRLFKRL